MTTSTAQEIKKAIAEQDILQISYTNTEGAKFNHSFEPYVIGWDLHKELVVWGIISGKNIPFRFLVDKIEIAEEPLAKFMVELKYKKQQPNDITPTAEVEYKDIEPWK